jgi:hypothetical protein
VKSLFSNCEYFFTRLPGPGAPFDEVPHFIAGEVCGRVVLPRLCICHHRRHRWPKALKRLPTRSTGLRCPSCGASILTHRSLILPADIFVCRCTLVTIDERLGGLRSARQWERLQSIYAKAKNLEGEFPVPSGIFGQN